MANRRPSQAAYDKLEATATRRVASLASQVASGKIDAQRFYDRMLDAVEKHGTQAAVLGRQRAGDLSPADDDDSVFGAVFADEQARFLYRFARDLDGGRYTDPDTGEIDADAVGRRAEMYAKRLLGLANEAFVLASPETKTFTWERHADESCSDCVTLAEGSPYKAGELEVYPRSGGTACKQGCKCTLRRSDGVTGFKAK